MLKNKMLIFILTISTIIVLLFKFLFFLLKLLYEWLEKWYKKQNKYLQIIILSFAISTPIIILMFLLDFYNIPTKLGYNSLNYKNWFDFILTGVSSFIATIISVTFVTLNTDKQLEQQQRYYELKEIDVNKPYFIYDFNPVELDPELRKKKSFIKSNDYGKKYGVFRIVLNNVGTGNAKNIRIKMKDTEVIYDGKLLKNYESFLASGDKACIDIINFTGVKKEPIMIEMVYEDIKGNNYTQIINIFPTGELIPLDYAVNINGREDPLIKIDDEKTEICPPK